MGRCLCFKPSSMRVPLLRPFTVSSRYSNRVEVSYFLCGWDCHHTSPYGGQADRATPFGRLVISRVLSAVTPISAPHQDSNSRLVYLRLRPHVLSHFTALRDLLPLYLFCSPQSVAVSATKSASEGLSLLQNHFWNILRRNVLPVPQASAYVATDSVQLKMNCRHLVQSPFDSTAWDLRVIRCFHISSAVQGRQKFQESSGMKTPKKERRVKKEKRIQPPMETPYVAPVPKRTVQFSPDKVIDIFEGMTLSELAQRTGNGVDALQDILMNIGEQISLEFQPISMDVAELIAMELGINVRRIHLEKGAKLQARPAVVTVMGHVDHGKTSLLDSLRQTSVAAKEAGGITQHLGAFVVSMASGASLTFLDTPGHAAFSAMRARGAAVTDIVVLVVAADDGVMPQTREAMAHAQAANVPVVVAINKCDKANADPQKVRIQLCSEGLALEEMGGEVQVVEISATRNIGLGKLEEAVLLQAELMDLKARVDGDARAYVVEARLDRGRGPLATAIVRSGTLVVGLHIVVGAEWGRIRALRDMLGRPVPSAGPSMPVEIEGLRGLPLAGDEVVVVASEERARKLSSGRKIRIEEERLIRQSEEKAKASDPVDEQVEKVEMTLIVKADVQGTVQAVTDALKSLNSSQVFVNVVHTGVGAISQSDVDLAQACGACIVGFNVRNMPSSVEAAARQANINDVIACDVINPDDIDVTFETIGGLDQVKQELHELVILPLQRPNLFAHGKLLGPQKGVLLYGPPGTGKTLLAKAIAKESGAIFINVRISNLMSKWFGDAQKLVTAVFTLAYKLQPAIIFIDEVDSFLGQRRSTEQEAVTNMKTEFMALWDGFTTDQNARVMVLAATNRPGELDEAILRRLPRAFEVGLPSCKERAKIFEVILKDENVEENIDYDYIASLCEGYSGSDLTELCKQAAYFPIRELLEQEKRGQITCEIPRPLKQSDLEKVLSASRTSKVAATEYSNRRQTDAQSRLGPSEQPEVSLSDVVKFLALVGGSTRRTSPDN